MIKVMKFLKVGGVILGALIITTLGISASDIFNGASGSLLGQIVSTEEGVCPSGMVEVSVGKTFSCIDKYEASTNDACPIVNPVHNNQTQDNVNDVNCASESTANKNPWTYISREQAQAVCVRAGKRLPTASEWYLAAIGTPDTPDSCNTDTGKVFKTGSSKSCVSAVGIQDAVGNVWEWTEDDVIQGVYNGKKIPEQGYVAQVASDGVATITSNNASEQFKSDYIWSQETGVYGLLRGGFYGSAEDAGVYAIQAKTAPTASTVAIGFRCVK